jgi:hypothetical protein
MEIKIGSSLIELELPRIIYILLFFVVTFFLIVTFIYYVECTSIFFYIASYKSPRRR